MRAGQVSVPNPLLEALRTSLIAICLVACLLLPVLVPPAGTTQAFTVSNPWRGRRTIPQTNPRRTVVMPQGTRSFVAALAEQARSLQRYQDSVRRTIHPAALSAARFVAVTVFFLILLVLLLGLLVVEPWHQSKRLNGILHGESGEATRLVLEASVLVARTFVALFHGLSVGFILCVLASVASTTLDLGAAIFQQSRDDLSARIVSESLAAWFDFRPIVMLATAVVAGWVFYSLKHENQRSAGGVI